ncbi:MAG: disulfide bond formation protein DsbB [Succinatimonas sp.]|nr:disulfide bond formation protein DsbB [Succinatimonas sp.]
MLRFIKEFSRTRFCWLLLILLGISLEGAGLYFQYGLHLDPCVNCVYERAWFLGFILAGLIGFLTAPFWFFRLIAVFVFLFSSLGGFFTAVEHYDSTQANTNIFASTCKLNASFPDFLKLDEWLPWMFKPSGSCGPLDWSFLSLSMPQWLIIIYVCGVLSSILILLSFLVKSQRYSRYDRYYH